MWLKMSSQTPSDVKNREQHKNGGVDNGGVGWSDIEVQHQVLSKKCNIEGKLWWKFTHRYDIG